MFPMTSQDLYRASQENHERDRGYGEKVGDKGCQEVGLGEVQELRDIAPGELMEDALLEMSASKPVPDDEEEDTAVVVPGNKLALDSLAEGFQLFRSAFDFLSTLDPFMIWALQQRHTVTEGLVPYENIFRCF